MNIVLDEDESNIIKGIATRENIDAEQLYDTYEYTMASNFEQDIHDLASELAADQRAYEETHHINNNYTEGV